MVLLISLVGVAAEPGFPQIAETRGYDALLPELEAVVAATKPKKLAAELDRLNFAAIAMPVKGVAGAALSVTDLTDLTDCGWDGTDVTCSFTGKVASGWSDGDYALMCRTRFGAGLAMAGEPTGEPTRTWTVRQVQRCWELGGARLQLEPVGAEDLEGIGWGDDTHAPEKVELDDESIRAVIEGSMKLFRTCHDEAKERDPEVGGVLQVKYTINMLGKISKAEIGRHTLADTAMHTCVLDRFGRLQFPPSHGGPKSGKFTFNFSR